MDYEEVATCLEVKRVNFDVDVDLDVNVDLDLDVDSLTPTNADFF